DFIREQNRRRTHNISGRYEIQLRKKSGEFIWVQISASPVSNAEGAVVGSIGVFTDITDRKRSEEALRVSEARFESLFDEVPDRSELPQPVRHASDDASAATISDLAQKINQVTDTLHNRVRQVLSFSSLASHELKTPLAIVRSQLENVMRPHVSAHILRKVLTSTYDEILRLNHTVGDLLSLGTMLAGTLKMNWERVEFLAALNDFYEEATLLCWEKEITIELEKGPEVFTELDVARFRQVLFNLLENSIKHTPPKGKISLRYRTQDHQVVFEFADTGSGIPKDQLARIFYPFAQASSERKDINGAGLGLALVIRIVEAHHGSIRVESEEGRGTTFTIRLPMHRSTPGQTA
ncbi:MAG: PAS domain-containing sensor histidine kinase, partial [Bacteroidota bacterium]